MTSTAGTFLLVTLALLACVEKLCAVVNFVSVEKDWVRMSRLEAKFRSMLRLLP